MKILFYVLLFLLLFIPLFPKLPLLDVSFTWTYIRLEDVLVAIAYLILGVLVWRRKARIKSFLFWPIVVFWLIGLISTVVNIPLLENNDGYVTYKPHLVVIHYLRRIEYLGLFFVAFAAIRSRDDVKKSIFVTVFTLVGVVIYGLGQQYLRFPQFLTMNEEFAKGTPLPLQDGARLSATFGGHYDLGGYLVLIIPIVVALCFAVQDIRRKLALGGLAAVSFFILILTSSRISFAALVIALALLLFSITRHKKIIAGALIVVMLLTVILGRDTILDRFSKTVRVRQVTYDPSTTRVLEPPTRNKDWGGLPESDSALLLPFTPIESTDSAYMVFKYKKSEYEKLLQDNPGMDVTAVPVPNVQTKEEMEENVSSGEEVIEEVRLVNGIFQRRWALVFDISLTTRVQGGWPIAWRAFLDNPLLGKGYSTVTAASDSSYMRALGEVGIAGFVSFFTILGLFLYRAYRFVRITKDGFLRMVVLGVGAGVFGLLINALLIDIFEASKVAFVMWMLIGIATAIIEKLGTSLGTKSRL